MADETTTDRNGDVMILARNNRGRLVACVWNQDMVNGLPSLPMREGDVVICSYAKSGCHWTWETARLLMSHHEAVVQQTEKEQCMIEMSTLEKLEALKSPRLLNNHGFFDEQPLSEMIAKGVKVIFVYRNLKSVATSFYHHHTRFQEYNYSATFDNYLSRFLDGLVDNDSAFSYLRGWEKGIAETPDLKVHVLSYEEMKKHPMEELRRLSKFLGGSEDEEFLKKVFEETDFDTMQKKKAKTTLYFDSNGLPVMYRKGTIGDWKNHFTVAQSELMDSAIQKELGDSKMFKFQYE
ncbi:sulfotransferase 1C4 [Aplysia californica]|uniref:Sulfotransferase 1C4 n=1 Tax=Aplysia californica TaxID=6500 RepID=A0ABM0K536_APLCA|nr:sulfotransferase 1C4 [Aplysia californica]